ncbi:MAG: biotin--[acetyl-CoA-carboxylase] ligase [Mycobacteriaceae bacterium]
MWTHLERQPLEAGQLQLGVTQGTGALWSSLEVVAETGSTNADLIARACPELDRAVLIADYQYAGRGRHARRWSSPPCSQVAMSVLIQATHVPLAKLGWLPLLAGVAVVEALRLVCNINSGLKWPNDILIGDKKVAGILAEVASGSDPALVVVGIGLNVTMQAEELPVPTATSLALAGDVVVDRATLIRAILDEFGTRVNRWIVAAGADAALVEEYQKLSVTIGQRVKASLPGDSELLGTAIGVDEYGRVLVDISGDLGSDIQLQSEVVAIAAGDITHLRPV